MPRMDEVHEKKSKKRQKKAIFVSYSPDAGYPEKKFIIELVRQLKDNNLAEDLWLDKDERVTGSPSWLSQRLEAVERCKAFLMILSESYLTCPVSLFEAKTILERKRHDKDSVHTFPILLSSLESEITMEKLKELTILLENALGVDLTGKDQVNKSFAEKVSLVVGQLMENLERFATARISPAPILSNTEWTGVYLTKKINEWTVDDLQEWLYNAGIKEFYRQALAEAMIDGFLLMSLTDYDMIYHLGIDSRPVRKKIMQHILQTLDKEHKMPNNWHLRARMQRAKQNTIYIIYDPSDIRLAHCVKQDLMKKGIQVFHHSKLGVSKDEFLYLNGPTMAYASFILVLLTEEAITSPFVFNELLLGEWLGKKIVSGLFAKTWQNLRPCLKAVLGLSLILQFT